MAARELGLLGFRVLNRNVYTCFGELDILAEKDGVLHFFEVRYKSGPAYGLPKESITKKKLLRMKKVMQYLMKKYGPGNHCQLGLISFCKMCGDFTGGEVHQVPVDEHYVKKDIDFEGIRCRMEIYTALEAP
ncbi:MAG: YraN family protein [Bacillota bacterium]|nr:YraN family protein [Bacillota bacterium]